VLVASEAEVGLITSEAVSPLPPQYNGLPDEAEKVANREENLGLEYEYVVAEFQVSNLE
tara:strand:- start:113 stop:289 length:177 start_codon:yes stop_codon:yes gene_type:complete